MANAIVAAERWLYATLTGDATLAGIVGNRVYGHVVPGGATVPYVFYSFQGAPDDTTTINAETIWSELVYAVRMVSKVESFTTVEAGAAAIHGAIHRERGSNISGDILACVQERPFAMIELDRDGFELRHLGGLYRLYVQ